MGMTIAVSGKGGSGKTTVASMIVRVLLEHAGQQGVLCIDADPNSCLAMALGVEPDTTVAELREQARNKPTNEAGMDRMRSFEYGLQRAITEAQGFDLVTMGQPEGPSCYCAVNNMLRKVLDQASAKYPFVVVDNEAGMEHLSRRTTNNVDFLCVVSEPTEVGKITARRICGLTRRLPISVGKVGILWNKTSAEPTGGEEEGEFSVLGRVPEDPLVLDASKRGASVFSLPADSAAFSAVRAMVEEVLAQRPESDVSRLARMISGGS
ncbi:MAG: AAA family ATPase [Phycisphaerales bacterium]|nr:MAG: AAA family ATPase [Phycisphaerales bacterium]